MTITGRVRILSHLVALTLVLTFAAVALAIRAEPAQATAPTATTTSKTHPYGDPVWFPLRDATSIGCAKSGCGTKADHGYWALDFIGTRGEKVYAAGAGVARIGGNSGACEKTQTEGRWVWIDHGAGVVTRYHHLNSITIKDGQLVTPATQIGTMGGTGDIAPCKTSYLHFEVRHNGVKGTRVDPGALKVCVPSGLATMPQLYGASSWNDPKLHTAPRRMTPASTNACITPGWLQTPAAPKPSVRRTSQRVTIGSGALPAGTTWMVRLDTYHPSTKAWGSPVYRLLRATTTSTAFTVDKTHSYRAYVSVHNGNGWSTAVGLSAPRPK